MILNSPIISGSLTVTGNIITSGSITISGSIASASYASNAELLDGLDATVFTLTSSFAAQTASFTAFSASHNTFTASILAQTASLNSFSSSILTFTGSASTRLGALESYTSSLNAKTASFATTGSNIFIGTQTITGSVLQSGSFTTTGTIIAQTINVQQVTSSIVYSSGSNIFGNALTNTQVFSGSVSMNPGGLFVSGSGNVGIGTTNPGVKLDINGSTRILAGAALYFQNTNASANATISAVGGAGNSDMAINVSGGNVGIGTASPAKRLHISGSGANSGITFDVDTVNTIIRGSSTSNFDLNNEGSGGCIRLYGSAIQFRTNVADPAVVINNGGCMGINCTAPTGMLTVGGDNNQIHVRGGYYASIYGYSGTQQVFGLYGNCDATYFNARGASGLYLGGQTSCNHIYLNTNGITCFFNTICVPSLRVQSAFADLTLCGSNTTTPHLGGTFSITTNQDGLGRTIIGNGSVGRAMYLESNGQAIFNCGVKFGNGSNCLNYYEQGTFTPAFGGTSAGCGVPGGANSALGYYTRIGNQVFLTVAVNSSVFPTFGGNLIMWLPFTACDQTGATSTITYHGPPIYFYPYSNWASSNCIVDITPYILGGNRFLSFNVYGAGADRQTSVNTSNSTLCGASGIYTRFSINYTAV